MGVNSRGELIPSHGASRRRLEDNQTVSLTLTQTHHLNSTFYNMDFKDLDSCTSLGGINIRMLGFVIQVNIYILRAKYMNLQLQLNSWPL